MILYDYLPSQNAWKVRLLLHQLDLPFETKLISIFEGEGQQPVFLEKNPTGAVPALELDDGRVIGESNAILFYLAQGTPFLPAEHFAQAKVVQWLSFEGDYLQSSVATLRHWTLTGKLERRPAELVESKRKGSLRSLAVMDRELAKRDFLACNTYTIADISAFAYVHLADEADLPLSEYRHVVAWIDRVRAQPRFLDQTWPYSIDPHSGNEL